MTDCVEDLAQKILDLLNQGKTRSEIVEMYKHEDADLVGEAMVEAESRLAKNGSDPD